jgi:cell division protein FtsZ
MIHFDLPKEQSSILKVIGVGGGGSNAVNHMFSQNIEGVNFIICNTDAQAIALSKVPNKIQLGPHLTQGLGAGANPSIGRQATEESLEEIKRILEVNTKMAFITAGMGGGTGTGGAPIIAKICKDLNILTVGIVTTPFAYEGKKRIAQAEEGINLLKDHVDTLLVISNDKLRHQFGNLKMKEAFNKADNVLATAAKCITDVINSTGQINVDFADVCTVMRDGGVAILGSAAAEGENRAQTAIESALTSPLLNDSEIKGAKWILININSAEGEHEFTMDEVEVIQNYLLSQAGEDTDVILGLGYDNTLGNQIGITLIATGFDHKNPFDKENQLRKKAENEKVVLKLDVDTAHATTSTPIPSDETTVAPATEKQEMLFVASNEIQIQDELMPTLKVYLTEEEKNAVTAKDEENKNEPIFFEISSSSDQVASVALDFEALAFNDHNSSITVVNEEDQATVKKSESTSENTTLNSGGYLAKPAQIYVEEKQTEQHSMDYQTPLQRSVQEEEPATEMQLVVKDDHQAAEEPVVQPTQPIMNTSVEEPALQDETEELRRRAMDRIAKLRSLSFNVNASDPNSEFETVPAYLRRNMDMPNPIADVESFYSAYTVKSNENNIGDIESLNTFLEGKKPD